MENKKICLQPAEAEPKAHNKVKYLEYTKLLDSMQEKTHAYKILRHLLKYGSITPMEAIAEYGNLRLSATVFNLKNLGVNIKTDTVYGKNRFGNRTHYAKYVLEGEDYEV